jgi:ribonuclease T1
VRLLACLLLGLALALPGVAAERVATRATTSEVAVSQLPPEARQTLDKIHAGGPFKYRQDGVVFGNRERLLPSRPRGYYHEYTVTTPGSRDRGARRIIAGSSGEFWYTDDHYSSFRRITGM